MDEFVDRSEIDPTYLIRPYYLQPDDKFETTTKTRWLELINQKRAGEPITPKERPATGNFRGLVEALRRSVGQEQGSKPTRKPAKEAAAKSQLASRGVPPSKRLHLFG